ncbi:MAG TPA: nucleotide exchange factor GrpE [Vicinamibacterales bacterium]|nr:nucleotide exchange factor GrpE [Vicinamibacterales bacterium]
MTETRHPDPSMALPDTCPSGSAPEAEPQQAAPAEHEPAAAPAGASPAPAPEEPRLRELARQRDEYYELLLRTRAEFDNYRKRIERERQDWAQTAAAELLRELLPVIDDLERALAVETSADGADAYRRGVELIHRQLLDLLRRRGVRPIETVGARFDPRWHQAVAYEPAPGRREGEIVEEYRRGYLFGDRLLRPAAVKVAAGEGQHEQAAEA